MENANKTSESNFLDFYQEWKQGINNTVLFSILSLVSIYFSIDNPYILIISVPLTIMSIVGIYIMIGNFQKHLKSQEKKQEAKLWHWENFYNFDRPHMAFHGKTPYEALKECMK